jgi:hypothetical protein
LRVGDAGGGVTPPSLLGHARVDAPLEQDFLRDVALRRQREDWLKEKEGITAGVVRDLKDEAKQRRDFDKTIMEFGDLLSLDASAREGLRATYGPIDLGHRQAILAALDASPPDYGSAYQEILQLYRDEDELIRERYGDAALLRFRQSQFERRTIILGVISAFADVPWDQLGW